MHSVANDTAEENPNVANVDSEIVIDRLGNADDAQALLVQLERDGQAAIAADRHVRVDAVFAERVDHLVGTVHFADVFRPPPVPRPRNGLPRLVVPSMVPPRCGMFFTILGIQLDQSPVGVLFRKEQAVVAVANSDDLPAQTRGGVHDRVDYRVESGRVAAAGVDADSLGLFGHGLLRPCRRPGGGQPFGHSSRLARTESCRRLPSGESVTKAKPVSSHGDRAFVQHVVHEFDQIFPEGFADQDQREWARSYGIG